MMESKVAEALSKKETLKARALSAETTKQLNESIVSMVCISHRPALYECVPILFACLLLGSVRCSA